MAAVRQEDEHEGGEPADVSVDDGSADASSDSGRHPITDTAAKRNRLERGPGTSVDHRGQR